MKHSGAESLTVSLTATWQVRAAFGDARLPPLPMALSSHPSTTSVTTPLDRGLPPVGSVSAAAAGISSRASAERSSYGGAPLHHAGVGSAGTSGGGAGPLAAGAVAGSPFAAAASQAAYAVTAMATPGSEVTHALPEVVPEMPEVVKPETAEAGIQADLIADGNRSAAGRSKAASPAAGAATYVMHGSDDEDAHSVSSSAVLAAAAASPNGAAPTVPARPPTPPRGRALQVAGVAAGPQPSPSTSVPHPARALSPSRSQRAPVGGGAAGKYVGQLQGELGKVAQGEELHQWLMDSNAGAG